MVRSANQFAWIVFTLVNAVWTGAPAIANTFNSTGPSTSDKSWQSPLAWSPSGVPADGDTAVFGVPGTYGVIVGQTNSLQNLNILAGNVTLYNTGGVGNLFVNYGPNSTISLPNSNGGTTFTLGKPGGRVDVFAQGLDVENGAELYDGSGSLLGLEDGSGLAICNINGTVIFTGAGSGFTAIGPNGTFIQYFVGVNNGTGLLALQNGSSSAMEGTLSIASGTTPGSGEVDLGAGSTLILNGNLAMSTSNINQTSALYIDGAGAALTQGDSPYGIPTSVVVGSSTNGSAAIYVSNLISGGVLSTGTSGLLSILKTGTVIVGSSTTTGTLNLNGNVSIYGGVLRVFSGSVFNLAAGKTLTIDNGGTADFKSFNINGSSINFVAGTLNYAGNLVVGTGGPLGVNLTLNSDRQLSLTGITTIDAAHTLSLSGSTLHTGSLVNNGTLHLVTGEVVAGSAALNSGSGLFIDLYGATRGTNYGALVASGSVSLGGALVVSLNFTPAIGNTFDILDGNLSGTFSLLTLPALPTGQTWNTSALYNTGVLSVAAAAGVVGDYNNNGIVDAADYVAWRNNQGTTHVLPNDPIGGTIGAAQYNQWRARFGQSSGSGSSLNATGSASAVPEPSGALLLLMATLHLSCRRGRIRR